MNRLSAVIIAFNEENNIRRCLVSLQGVADEIVVVDSNSTDRTAEICSSFGCRIFQREFTGYSEQKQFAVDVASSDWVLSIDADEEITPELKEEIRSFFRGEQGGVNGCYIPRDLVYMGKRMKFGGTAGEKIMRLFNRQHGRFDGAAVHEKVLIDGPVRTFRGKLLHYSHRDLGHHLDKINEYSRMAAEENVRKGRKYPGFWVVVKFKVSFFTLYILKGGILDGYEGFIWALMGSVYTSLKISRTIEMTKTKSGQ
jgi:glycosyltransferase involved in cell wall biosynthesis